MSVCVHIVFSDNRTIFMLLHVYTVSVDYTYCSNNKTNDFYVRLNVVCLQWVIHVTNTDKTDTNDEKRTHTHMF